MLDQILVLIGCVIAIPVGAIVVFLIYKTFISSQDEWLFSLSVPLCVGALVWILVGCLVTPAWYFVFRHQVLTFHENLNTVVVGVHMTPIACTRDGECKWTYPCDPYTVTSSSTTKDSEGKTVTKTSTTTRYHDCPYVQVEQRWDTITSLKTNSNDPNSANVVVTEADHRLPGNPQAFRFRLFEAVPASVMNQAGVGIPPVSAYYQRLLQAGQYPAISLEHGYDNELLSDPDTSLRPSVPQADIDRLRKQHLLPSLSLEPDPHHRLNKVEFLGMAPPSDAGLWQRDIAALNAEAGQARQLDLHLVIVPESAVPDLHAYALDLRGYWSDTAAFAKAAFPKNAALLILSTDGRVVKHAEMATLMPSASGNVSNNLLIQDIQQEVPGTPLSPDRVLGFPRPVVQQQGNDAYQVTYQHGGGILESLLITGPHAFQRVPMSNFRYLDGEILPTPNDCWWIGIISFLLSAGCGWIAAALLARR